MVSRRTTISNTLLKKKKNEKRKAPRNSARPRTVVCSSISNHCAPLLKSSLSPSALYRQCGKEIEGSPHATNNLILLKRKTNGHFLPLTAPTNVALRASLTLPLYTTPWRLLAVPSSLVAAIPITSSEAPGSSGLFNAFRPSATRRFPRSDSSWCKSSGPGLAHCFTHSCWRRNSPSFAPKRSKRATNPRGWTRFLIRQIPSNCRSKRSRECQISSVQAMISLSSNLVAGET